MFAEWLVRGRFRVQDFVRFFYGEVRGVVTFEGIGGGFVFCGFSCFELVEDRVSVLVGIFGLVVFQFCDLDVLFDVSNLEFVGVVVVQEGVVLIFVFLCLVLELSYCRVQDVVFSGIFCVKVCLFGWILGYFIQKKFKVQWFVYEVFRRFFLLGTNLCFELFRRFLSYRLSGYF